MNTASLITALPIELFPAICATPRDYLALSLTCRRFRGEPNPFTWNDDDIEIKSAWYTLRVCSRGGVIGPVAVLSIHENSYKHIAIWRPKYILTVPGCSRYVWYADVLPEVFPSAPSGYCWYRRDVVNCTNCDRDYDGRHHHCHRHHRDDIITSDGSIFWLLPAGGEIASSTHTTYKKIDTTN